MARINSDLLRREGVRLVLYNILVTKSRMLLDDVSISVSIPTVDDGTYIIRITGSLLKGSFTIDRNSTDDRSIEQALLHAFPELAI